MKFEETFSWCDFITLYELDAATIVQSPKIPHKWGSKHTPVSMSLDYSEKHYKITN